MEGPAAGIDGPTYITPQLDGLYQSSQSYPAGATPNLMTGVAEEESNYFQFLTPLQGNADLFQLFANFAIAAKWPYQSKGDGGSHIGLMMFQTTTVDAWNWLQNTTDGVNLFSGTTSPNKISIAFYLYNRYHQRYEGQQPNSSSPWA